MSIVPTPRKSNCEKCLPSRTFSIGGIYPLSNNSEIHIIFLTAYINNHMSHCNSAHPPKSNHRKVPALECTFDQGLVPSV